VAIHVGRCHGVIVVPDNLNGHRIIDVKNNSAVPSTHHAQTVQNISISVYCIDA